MRDNNIDVLVDVRSNPYSRFASHFNKDNIKSTVHANGMKYLFLGKELGGRAKNPEFYNTDGHVLHSKIAESPLFAEVIKRLIKGIKTYRVAIMCSEENPAHCHRRLFVGRALSDIQILHIRRDGMIKSEDGIVCENNLKRSIWINSSNVVL